MLSIFRLNNWLSHLLFRFYCANPTQLDVSPGEQLRSELAAAAEYEMVATRSQDHTPGRVHDVSQSADSDAKSHLGKGKKRRNMSEASTIEERDRSKRRRTNASPEHLGSSASQKVAPQENSHSRRQTAHSTILTYENGLDRPNDGIEVRIVTNARSPNNLVTAGGRTPPINHRQPPEVDSSNDVSAIATQPKPMQSAPTTAQTTQQSAYKNMSDVEQTPKAAHKRFTEEEAFAISRPASDDGRKDDAAQTTSLAVNDETGSEDEAPETVTASQGHHQALLAANEAAQVVERYNLVTVSIVWLNR